MSTPGLGEMKYQQLFGYQSIIDEASATVTYIGESIPGTATSTAQWRIKKIDETSNPTTIKWADGDPSLSKIWDDRATYTY